MDNNKILSMTSGVVLVFLAGLILRLAKPVFFPFFLAIFFYFILSPVLDFLTRLKIPRAVALFLIIAVAFSALYLLGVLVYSSGQEFAESFPEYARRMSALSTGLTEKIGRLSLHWDPGAWSRSLDADRVAAVFLSSLNKFFSFFSTFVLIFVFLVFMLAGRGKLMVKVEKSFPSSRAKKINQVIENIDSQVQKYLLVKTGVSAISGVVTGAVLAAFGVRYAILFGFLTFLLNFIPSLGSIIAISFSSAMAAFQLTSFWRGFWIFLILAAIELLIANFLEPKLMGYGLGLSPLAVLFSLFFWGWLWGIPGMILAVPLMAMIKIGCANVPSLQFIAEIISK
jgi:AI-2 transport protein TqsA